MDALAVNPACAQGTISKGADHKQKALRTLLKRPHHQQGHCAVIRAESRVKLNAEPGRELDVLRHAALLQAQALHSQLGPIIKGCDQGSAIVAEAFGAYRRAVTHSALGQRQGTAGPAAAACCKGGAPGSTPGHVCADVSAAPGWVVRHEVVGCSGLPDRF